MITTAIVTTALLAICVPVVGHLAIRRAAAAHATALADLEAKWAAWAALAHQSEHVRQALIADCSNSEQSKAWLRRNNLI